MNTKNKVCSMCKIEKPISEFHLDYRRDVPSIRSRCKPCNNKAARASSIKQCERDPEYCKARNRRNSRILTYRKYGVTEDQVLAMGEKQSWRCAICKIPISYNEPGAKGTKTNVDHNHTTFRVRGLLCSKCNGALGMLEDSFIRILKAGFYLFKHDIVRKYTRAK